MEIQDLADKSRVSKSRDEQRGTPDTPVSPPTTSNESRDTDALVAAVETAQLDDSDDGEWEDIDEDDDVIEEEEQEDDISNEDDDAISDVTSESALRLNVLDRIIAMVFSRLPMLDEGGEEKHYRRLATMHKIIKDLWVREFGALPT